MNPLPPSDLATTWLGLPEKKRPSSHLTEEGLMLSQGRPNFLIKCFLPKLRLSCQVLGILKLIFILAYNN